MNILPKNIYKSKQNQGACDPVWWSFPDATADESSSLFQDKYDSSPSFLYSISITQLAGERGKLAYLGLIVCAMVNSAPTKQQKPPTTT